MEHGSKRPKPKTRQGEIDIDGTSGGFIYSISRSREIFDPGKGREASAATQDSKQDPDKRSEPISSCKPTSFEEGKGQKDQKGQSSSCQSQGRSASCARAKAKEDSESEKAIEACTVRYEVEGLLRMLAVQAQGAFALGRGLEVLGLKREPSMPTM